MNSTSGETRLNVCTYHPCFYSPFGFQVTPNLDSELKFKGVHVHLDVVMLGTV